MYAKSLHLCPTLCDPWIVVHGILQAGILEWVAITLCRDFSHPGIEPASLMSPALDIFTTSTTWEAQSKV